MSEAPETKRAAAAVFGCQCGEVRGRLFEPSPSTVNRVVCYCDDCQAFAHLLRRDDLLDERGGTDIVQVAPAALVIDSGRDHLAAVRLSSKGLYRFHSTCCQTPLGNTVGPAIPFVGIPRQAFELNAQEVDGLFGPVAGEVYGQYATRESPGRSQGVPLRMLVRALRRVLSWGLSGQSWPHPFFDRSTRASKFPVNTLSAALRDALRPRCGPNATTIRQ
jgi:hypothetical protein